MRSIRHNDAFYFLFAQTKCTLFISCNQQTLGDVLWETISIAKPRCSGAIAQGAHDSVAPTASPSKVTGTRFIFHSRNKKMYFIHRFQPTITWRHALGNNFYRKTTLFGSNCTRSARFCCTNCISQGLTACMGMLMTSHSPCPVPNIMQLLKHTWFSWHIFVNAFLYGEEAVELSKYQPAPCSWFQHTH